MSLEDVIAIGGTAYALTKVWSEAPLFAVAREKVHALEHSSAWFSRALNKFLTCTSFCVPLQIALWLSILMYATGSPVWLKTITATTAAIGVSLLLVTTWRNSVSDVITKQELENAQLDIVNVVVERILLRLPGVKAIVLTAIVDRDDKTTECKTTVIRKSEEPIHLVEAAELSQAAQVTSSRLVDRVRQIAEEARKYTEALERGSQPIDDEARD